MLGLDIGNDDTRSAKRTRYSVGMVHTTYHNLWRIPRYPFGRIAATILILSLIGYEFGVQWLHSSSIRTVVFLALLLFLLGVSLLHTQLGLFLLTIYLPLLGWIRRLLIPISGWGSFDPLVILVAIVVLVFGSFWLYKRYFLRAPLVYDTAIFRVVRWFILLDILEIGNPKQGSISVGLGGIVFYVVPLFWMVLSRQHLSRKWIVRTINLVVLIGVLTALYGLKQTFLGYYPFEKAWISDAGYTALSVNGTVRAVSTFANAQEYATYLAGAMAASWGFVLRGRLIGKCLGFVFLAIMGYALFMESARSSIVLTAIGLAIMTILSGRTIRRRIVISVLTGLVLVGLFIGLSHVHSNNNLVNHDVAGLTHPFNSKDSSLSGHSARMLDGVITGIKMPIGYGLGSTTLAASKFSSQDGGTEVDLSNIFVSDGIIGGVLYLTLAIMVFVKAIRQASTRDKLSLIVLGMLISDLGQWLNGGLYSTSALMWVLIGYLDRRMTPKPNQDV